MGLSAALKAAAVARMARGQEPLVRSPSSQLDQELRWENTKGLIARAVVADPDVAYYFRGLVITKAIDSLLAVKEAAEDLLVSLAGTDLPQRPLNEERLQRLAKSGRKTEELVKGGLNGASLGWLSDPQWDAALREMGAALQSGNQVGPRGLEAQTSAQEALSRLESTWATFSKYLSCALNNDVGTPEQITSLAVRSALTKTLQTLEMSVPYERLTEYVNQAAAGFSATKAASQGFSFAHRILIIPGEQTYFPSGFSVSTGATGAWITEFRITEDKTGKTVSGSLLNIKSGDSVLVNGQDGSVSQVTNFGFTVSSGVFPAEERAYRLEVTPFPSFQAQLLREVVAKFPTEAVGQQLGLSGAAKVNYLEEFGKSVAEVKRMYSEPTQRPLLAQLLYNLVLSVDSPSVAATRAYSRIGGLPTRQYPQTMTTLLNISNPMYYLGAEQGGAFLRGRELLRLLRTEGWLRAYSELSNSGSLSSILSMGPQDATYENMVSEMTRGIRNSEEMWNAGVR